MSREDGDWLWVVRALFAMSAAICEYLEEAQPGAALHPADSLERARHRAWIEFGSSILADPWSIETATDSVACDRQRQVLVEKFSRLEVELGAASFIAERHFSTVDAAYAPAFSAA
jgi:glutathione S-transferase